ncbi:immunity 22 family protein [Acinetobacter baumannii]|nr:immunity 22 family protein [Acinetobacter baumannii]
MSLNAYSDDNDYYNQGFEKEGIVSIWAGILGEDVDPNLDILRDLCGVGYYNLDDQETNNSNFEMISLNELLEDLSYSKSFINEVIDAAFDKGIVDCRWVIVQYDFDYNPFKVKRRIAKDPIFIGSFKYSVES